MTSAGVILCLTVATCKRGPCSLGQSCSVLDHRPRRRPALLGCSPGRGSWERLFSREGTCEPLFGICRGSVLLQPSDCFNELS